MWLAFSAEHKRPAELFKNINSRAEKPCYFNTFFLIIICDFLEVVFETSGCVSWVNNNGFFT